MLLPNKMIFIDTAGDGGERGLGHQHLPLAKNPTRSQRAREARAVVYMGLHPGSRAGQSRAEQGRREGQTLLSLSPQFFPAALSALQLQASLKP